MSAEGSIIEEFGQPIPLRVRVPLNIRAQPTRAASLVGRRPAAEMLLADRLLDAETYLDTSYWYRLHPTGWFVWAGGVERVLPDPPLPQAGTPVRVKRRADGTIRPLSDAELRNLYGPFDFDSNANGSIRIDPAWVAGSIVPFTHPLLAQMELNSLKVHRNALMAFRDVFDAIDAAGKGVADCLHTCAGTFVPRHIRRDPARPLSSHSFGVAIDLNAEWNGYGARPLQAGLHGSVRELVPYFAHAGFAWGGHFSGSSADGMHFELARY